MKLPTQQTRELLEELLDRARQLAVEGDAAAEQALEEMELFWRDKVNLVMDIYRETNCFDDLIAANGFGSLREDLLSMVSGARGSSCERKPQECIPTLDEVSEKLKQNLVTSRKALAIHAELMQLETELKACVNAALAGPSAEKSEEFKKCLTELLQFETESLDWIRADKLHNIAITADPDSPEQEFYGDIAIGDNALSNVVEDGRRKWNYTATADQPNDEPVMHWAAQKRALLTIRHKEMEKN
ncbi:MAG: hypothetical protein IT343_17980 [Candidatus Melainabacteria bacterium]|jgi:hypothetical protein|nr:hypothetical protein [Candidatus Melainabacteria bacterium]